jgi:RNA polymerase sigma-70 factor (ECF subfamily)
MMGRSRAIDLLRESHTRGRAADRLKLVVSSGAGREPARLDVPGEALVRDGDRAVVREAVKDLPVAQREALVLAYWGGMTAEQIAERASIPLGTAKSRMRLGLAKLRTDLDHAPAAA